jgi:hypothetical protein
VTSGIRALARSVWEIVVGLLMPSSMETIRERLTHIERVLGPLAEKENQSVNDRLAYVVEMEKRVVE